MRGKDAPICRSKRILPSVRVDSPAEQEMRGAAGAGAQYPSAATMPAPGRDLALRLRGAPPAAQGRGAPAAQHPAYTQRGEQAMDPTRTEDIPPTGQGAADSRPDEAVYAPIAEELV